MYPKARRENAAEQFASVCDTQGKLYIDEFEDYLIARWPDANQVEVMKTLDRTILDRLKDGHPMTEEVRNLGSKTTVIRMDR
jgi:hypothetical protein